MAIYVQCDGAQKNIFDFVTVSLPKSDTLNKPVIF